MKSIMAVLYVEKEGKYKNQLATVECVINDWVDCASYKCALNEFGNFF